MRVSTIYVRGRQGEGAMSNPRGSSAAEEYLITMIAGHKHGQNVKHRAEGKNHCLCLGHVPITAS